MSFHRCRPSCAAEVPQDKAFCRECWARVPQRVKNAILSSWREVKRDPNHIYAHAELLLDARHALEGDRPWESVAPA